MTRRQATRPAGCLCVTLQAKGFPMAETKQDNAAASGKIVARAWRDPAFKAKLLADPHAALEGAGISVPAGVTVKVVENTDTHVHFVLPPKPTQELSDEELDKVAAGMGGTLKIKGEQGLAKRLERM